VFTVVSTFSGCGGSSLGYKQAGGKVLLAVEWDKNAAETYRLNFPETDLYYGDISKLTTHEIFRRTGLTPGELDILDGSPPCQGFSTIGKRKFTDDRNQLFREYCRLLRDLKPKVFVMENVEGMVQGNMKLIFAEAMRSLKACGYTVRARVLNAMYYGVPQWRKRLIFIGVRNDLCDSFDLKPSHPIGTERIVGLWEAIKDVKSKTFAPEGRGASIVLPYITQGKSALECVPKELLKEYIPKVLRKTAYDHKNSCVRAHPDRPARTITKMFIPYSNFLIHPYEHRHLSAEELKRVASFPDSFKLIGTYLDQVARLGNSVPPKFMRAIALHIKENILSKIDPVSVISPNPSTSPNPSSSPNPSNPSNPLS